MSTLNFRIKEHTVEGQYIREYRRALLESPEDTLYLSVKQYTPLDGSHRRPGAVTIIGAHANAFPKELYEPLWDHLYDTLKSQGQAIAGIWIADVAHQGKSGVLNERKLGNDPSWADHPRDLLHIINHFRKEMPRPLVGIGHSMGGNHLVNLSYMHPSLFSSLVLIDPVIHYARSSAPSDDSVSSSNAQSSTFRRDRWNSSAEAAASLKRHPFYQTWDPRVLELWLKYGLRRLPTALYPLDSDDSEDSDSDDVPVTLTTTKHQEVFTFLRPKFTGKDTKGRPRVNRRTHPDIDLSVKDDYPFYRPEPSRTFENLQSLRPSVLYVFGGKSELSKPEWRKAKMDRTGTGVGGSGGAKEGRVKEVLFDDLGHLIPMIGPKRTAKAAGEWLAEDLERWQEEEEEFQEEWDSKSRLEKTTVSKEWERNIGGNPRGKGTQKL